MHYWVWLRRCNAGRFTLKTVLVFFFLFLPHVHVSTIFVAISKHGLAALYVYSRIGFSLYVQAFIFLNVRAEFIFLVMSWFLDSWVFCCWHDCCYSSKHRLVTNFL